MDFTRDLSLDDILRDASRHWRQFVYAKKLRPGAWKSKKGNARCRISSFASSMSMLHDSQTRLENRMKVGCPAA